MKKAFGGDAVDSAAKNFRPAADLLPGGAGTPKFNQLEMVTTFTYKPNLVRIDACKVELSHTQTNTPTHKQTGPITIHCAASVIKYMTYRSVCICNKQQRLCRMKCNGSRPRWTCWQRTDNLEIHHQQNYTEKG